MRVGGLLPSQTLKDRLLSINVTLNNGHSNDQLSLSFDDRPGVLGNSIHLPTQGKTIDIAMGYETYLTSMGRFQVNHISLDGSGSGRTLTVAATTDLMLTQKTQTWATTTIGAMVTKIAGEHGLIAKVSPVYQTQAISVVNQDNESDLAFLNRLAERYNAVCKPLAGNLLFMKKGQGTLPTGLPMLLPVSIRPQDIVQWSSELNEREDYSKVIACWLDWTKGAYQEVSAPAMLVPGLGKQNVYRLRHLYNTAGEAKAAAKAKFDELNRGDSTLSMTVIGNPDISAEGSIAVSGLRSGVNGRWIVKSATHSFSSGGYQTSIQAYMEPTALAI
ncbi:hypothetical protein AB835_03830 [Candidatus Endobugula sertula]|uniref:Phage tail protein n=1 Tax=Candidatus Endobugula sertula TaxID=62101 RepID=A0A1D2QS63_9GAMM|nr:hypothetical protein AB835_03830 [Candidatus Endobugula sertula]